MQATYTNNASQVASLGAGGPQVASLDAQAMALGYDDKSLAPPLAYGPGLAFWTRAHGAWGFSRGGPPQRRRRREFPSRRLCRRHGRSVRFAGRRRLDLEPHRHLA